MADDLTGIIKAHKPSRWRSVANDCEILRCCGVDFGRLTGNPRTTDSDPWDLFAAHVAETIRESRTITTIEQLDALRANSVVASNGRAWVLIPGSPLGGQFFHELSGPRDGSRRMPPKLPVTLLWQPKDEETDR